MRVRSFLLGLIAASVLCYPAAAWAKNEAAAQDFARGKALLAGGDFQGALTAFKAAVKAEPDNDEYFRQCALLQRVVRLRSQLKDEQDADAWQQMARALYSFYSQAKLYGEALPLARTLHEKVDSGESAGMLADTLLALDKNEDAAALLSALDAGKSTPHTLALQGLALAHLGKQDEARAVAAKLEIPKDCDADLCYDAARLHALLGQAEKALLLLTRSLETTAADQLDAARANVKACKDLAKLAGMPEFAKVLETKTKAGAGCGTKAGCGKCPMKEKAVCGEKSTEGASKESEKDTKKGAGCEHEKK